MPLKGLCNRCGNCCVIGQMRCEHLSTDVTGRTTCMVYDKRYTNMPIKMIAPDGATMDAYCIDGSIEGEYTLRDLIREGKCSLEEG